MWATYGYSSALFSKRIDLSALEGYIEHTHFFVYTRFIQKYPAR
jgi:hypothetical protein